MNYFLKILIIFKISLLLISCVEKKCIETDILIIGGGASGVAAGVQIARMGANALIVEENEWLGGMLTSAGVSAIDGNYNLPAGLWGEFKTRLINHYGHLDSLKTGWVSNVLFEPSIGNQILHDIVEQESKLQVFKSTSLLNIKKYNDEWIATLEEKNGKKVQVNAKIVIDATELGDIAKLCGVGYDIGMESKYITNEDVAPDSANNIIQDLTYVAILKDYGVDVTIPRPDGYDPKEFACACANDVCITPKEPDRLWSKDMMISYGKLPNNKYMINWPIEGNDYYLNLIEMNAQERSEALEYAKNYTMKFLYFIQHELGLNTLGLADDEYPTDDLLPFIPYHRESRRIHGLVRFNLNDLTHPYEQEDKLYRTTIAVGDYPVDHHHTRYHGYEELPDLYFYPIPSYGLPLGTLIPHEVDNLIVAEKSISVSNIVNGTTRLQPVVIQIGQAAGALAALSFLHQKNIKDVSTRDVQNAILESGGYLLPFLDVEVGNIIFKPLQRIGATGILKGKGKNVDWSNETWLYADSLVHISELEGLLDYYPTLKNKFNIKDDNTITIAKTIEWIDFIISNQNSSRKMNTQYSIEEIWEKHGFDNLNLNRNIKRGEFAVLIDQILDPFNNYHIDIKGELIN